MATSENKNSSPVSASEEPEAITNTSTMDIKGASVDYQAARAGVAQGNGAAVLQLPVGDATSAIHSANAFRLTVFVKANNESISKHIALGPDGKPVSDGSQCAMSRATAYRHECKSLTQFADLITNMKPYVAIALGTMREGFGRTVPIVSRDMLEKSAPGTIAREKGPFYFPEREPALLLLDYDQKAMPQRVRDRMNELEGFVSAIRHIVPAFARTGFVIRKSTSAGLYNTETGHEFGDSGGLHLYAVAKDGADIPRALKVLQKRAWLDGLGWIYISAAGSLLIRSIVDVTVGSPERLVFEGAPTTTPPLAQHKWVAEVCEGEALDTRAALLDLTADEEQEYARRVAEAKRVAKPEADKVIKAAIERAVKKAVAKGIPEPLARETAKRAYAHDGDRVLLPLIPLLFDNPDIGEVTVADVLKDPQRFDGLTLADPLETHDDRGNLMRNRAVVTIGAQHGDVLIYSQLHGGYRYVLRYDRAQIEKELEALGDSNPATAREFIRMMLMGDASSPVSEADESSLVALVAKKSGATKTAVKNDLKAKRAERKRAEQQGRRADWLDEAAYAGVSDDSPSDPHDWPDGVTPEGLPRPSLRNTMFAIEALGVEVIRDDHKKVEFLSGPVDGVLRNGERVSDELIALLRLDIAKRWGPDLKKELVGDAVFTLAAQNHCHPLREEIDNLKWDRAPRVVNWLTTYLGADDTALNRAIGKTTLVAAVRRIRQPGCKFDNMLILEGSQGTGKSSALRVLAGEKHFSDADVLHLAAKEQIEQLEGVWIQEIPELVGMTKTDVRELKTFMSRQKDKARRAYGRFVEEHPRQFILIGTTNETTYLKDETGNRRFWPVKTGVIDYKALERDRDLLLAEAAALEASGESITLPEELWAVATEEQEARRIKDSAEERLSRCHRARSRDVGQLLATNVANFFRISTLDIETEILNGEVTRARPPSSEKIGAIMRRNGWFGPRSFNMGAGMKFGYEKHAAAVLADDIEDGVAGLRSAIDDLRSGTELPANRLDLLQQLECDLVALEEWGAYAKLTGKRAGQAGEDAAKQLKQVKAAAGERKVAEEEKLAGLNIQKVDACSDAKDAQKSAIAAVAKARETAERAGFRFCEEGVLVLDALPF